MGYPTEEQLKKIYGADTQKAEARFAHLREEYRRVFKTDAADAEYFTAPGRTEIIGNHTDHNGGRILAGSVMMDTIAAAEKTEDGVITVVSEGYKMPFSIDLKEADKIPHNKGTLSLLAGMAEAFKKFGYQTGGFRAYVSSNVMASAGVSSSASFEMLICSVLNYFYNDESIGYPYFAKIGQYAENVYWEKASGLMDQMACACGGTILLDFSDDVKYERVDFSFDMLGYDEILINTGKGHADLSEEYSAVPNEMRAVAAALGGKNLCDVREDDLLKNLPEIRTKIGNDRAVLRALHYFEECRRVDRAAEAVRAGKLEEILRLIDESGQSSFEWLENAYVAKTPEEQSVPLALAMTEIFIRKHKAGACRLHGGGFGGVIMAVLPKELTEEYRDYMSPVFGRENICVTGIRKVGAVHIG
ncbi:MAG: galactokinase family protein [Eubacteriales bacterium]|jgi:galactokinase